jgi:predicted amidophosphoribosyltransferase
MIDAATVARQSSSLSWRARLRAGARHVLNLGLPPLCPTCREPVADQGGLCAHCWSKRSFIARPYCERLGIPFAYDPGPGILSMEAIADPPTYNRARAAVRYDDTARTMVQAFKYGDRLDLAPAMGRWMAQAGHELLTDADALIPVPLHWRRLWMRRFNQAATLAKTISLLRVVYRLRTTCFAAYVPPPSRSGSPRPNVLSMCRVHSGSPPIAAWRYTAGGWCLWTTS